MKNCLIASAVITAALLILCIIPIRDKLTLSSVSRFENESQLYLPEGASIISSTASYSFADHRPNYTWLVVSPHSMEPWIRELGTVAEPGWYHGMVFSKLEPSLKGAAGDCKLESVWRKGSCYLYLSQSGCTVLIKTAHS